MKVEKTKKKIIPAILILGIWLILAQSVAAEEGGALTLMVEQDFEGLDQETEKIHDTGTYRLTAVSENAPMPEGSKKEGYLFSLKGSGEKKKISLKFTKVGTFVYTLMQTTEDRKNYSFDRTEYTITVHTKSNDKGQIVPVVIVENEAGEKCGEIKFQNSFKRKERPGSGSSGGAAEQGGSSHAKDSVKTADSSSPGAWLALCLLSLGVILIFAAMKKNSKSRRF